MKRSSPPEAKVFQRRFGARLRQTRLRVGLSQQEAVKPLEISFQQLQNYETGKHRIGPWAISKLAERYGVAVSAFFEEVAAMPPGCDRRTARLTSRLNRLAPQVRATIENLVRTMAGNDREVPIASPTGE